MSVHLNARDLMQIPVHSVPPEMPLWELEREFLDRRVSGFPVVDNGQLVGVVSRADIVGQLLVERRLAQTTSDFYWEGASFHEEPAESIQQIANYWTYPLFSFRGDSCYPGSDDTARLLAVDPRRFPPRPQPPVFR